MDAGFKPDAVMIIPIMNSLIPFAIFNFCVVCANFRADIERESLNLIVMVVWYKDCHFLRLRFQIVEIERRWLKYTSLW